MFNDRAANSNLNHLYEEAVRLACKDSESELEKLKEKHVNNMQLFMIEIFKTINNLNPKFMKIVLTERNIHYTLRREIICNCQMLRQQHMEFKIYSI